MQESIALYGTLNVNEIGTDTRTKDRFYGFHLINLEPFDWDVQIKQIYTPTIFII